tara:strand:- start:734 stop:1369 length:636 start_codon:yes stop_codon:yes gene_type:complete
MKLKLILYIFAISSFCFSPKAKENFDCRKLASLIEKKIKLPNKLLSSISLTETGYSKNGTFAPWPWTLNVNGKSEYFDTKKEMASHLHKKLSENITNIDIGCMQINYIYHSKNFRNIDDMINPHLNVEYAGKFLVKLFNKYKSWNKAISYYHSSDPKRMREYLEKVKRNWDLERQKRKFNNQKELSKKNNLNQKRIIFFRQKLENEKPYFM